MCRAELIESVTHHNRYVIALIETKRLIAMFSSQLLTNKASYLWAINILRDFVAHRAELINGYTKDK